MYPNPYITLYPQPYLAPLKNTSNPYTFYPSFPHSVCSQISRESINAVKNFFREDLQKSDWQLMIELKRTFEIL